MADTLAGITALRDIMVLRDMAARVTAVMEGHGGGNRGGASKGTGAHQIIREEGGFHAVFFLSAGSAAFKSGSSNESRFIERVRHVLSDGHDLNYIFCNDPFFAAYDFYVPSCWHRF